MTIDYTQPYCTYETRHPTGLFYRGKGRTAAVLNGTYIGSGTRLKLALTHPDYPRSSWTTTVLSTHPTADLAYAAEERLVPHDLLRDPFCLNMVAGGRRGRYLTPNALLKKEKKVAKKQTLADWEKSVKSRRVKQ